MYRRSVPKSYILVTPEQLEERIAQKQTVLDQLEKQYNDMLEQLDDDPQQIVDSHIKALKNYNEMKDLALKFVAKISEQRSMTIKQVLDEMNVSVEP